MKQCPYCAEQISEGVQLCPHCGEGLAVEGQAQSNTGIGPEASAAGSTGPVAPRKRRKKLVVLLVLFSVVMFVASSQFTLFVVQPIGAVPEGRTLLISRLNKGMFVDSADAMCQRTQGGVSLLCRGVVLGQVMQNTTVYLRFPYSETLYLLSTDGKTYGK